MCLCEMITHLCLWVIVPKRKKNLLQNYPNYPHFNRAIEMCFMYFEGRFDGKIKDL